MDATDYKAVIRMLRDTERELGCVYNEGRLSRDEIQAFDRTLELVMEIITADYVEDRHASYRIPS